MKRDRDKDIFQKILVRAAKEGVFPIFDKKSRDWFRKRAQDITGVTPEKTIKEKKLSAPMPPKPGDCLIFKYTAKWAKVLPYWDEYPVIFVLDIWEKERKILGINLHYLPYVHRAKLMDALYSLLSITDSGYRMKLSYKYLKRYAKYISFIPCIKQYHFGNIGSKMAKIEPSEYDIALFLPLARWKKASQETVWNDSVAKIKSAEGKRVKRKRKKS